MSPREPSLPPQRILVVEDEALIALEMEMVIEDLGHRCVGTAADLKNALALASPDVDLALVDVNLADGSTGPQVGAALAADHGIAVIFVTANPAMLGDGVDGTLGAVEKPIDVATLQQVLDFVIAQKKGGPAPSPPPALNLFESRAA